MAKSQTIDLLQHTLENKGYTFKQLKLGSENMSFTQITSPVSGSIILSSDNPLLPFATSSSRLIYADKTKSYELASSLGIAVPQTISVKTDQPETVEQALHLINSTDKVIVKPTNASGSAGLTRDIENPDQLHVALAIASKVSSTVLVQKQFYGEELRFSVVNGVVRSVLLRQKPFIQGDGHSSVNDLIQKENIDREQLTGSLVTYPQLTTNLLDEALLTSTQVLRNAERWELNKNTMISGGASIFEVLSTVHSEYIAIVERLAGQFGNGFLAIDLMIENYEETPANDGYVFLEININPALSLYYSCRDGNHTDIVGKYLAPMLMRAIDKEKHE